MRLVALFLLLFPVLLSAEVPDAYTRYGNQYGVPPKLLYAIAKTESARPGKPHPWPWTANVEGKAFYYERRLDLYKALEKLVEDENFNFDVGVMQISWKWNADLFGGDLWAATDPTTNLEAGARHLSKLRQKTGSFNTAVALYHVGSMNTENRKKRALAYNTRVLRNIPSNPVATNE